MRDKNRNMVFAAEKAAATSDDPLWKLMIVDDEEEVHRVTRMVVRDFSFEGRGFECLSAYSAAQARELIREHPDTAVILLDVVMETNQAGLEFVRFIREEVRDRRVRIILRTGQPGHAPEREVVDQYDINDYKQKTELTAERLYTTIIGAVRSYKDLVTIERSMRGLERVIASSGRLLMQRDAEEFCREWLEEFRGLVRQECNTGRECTASGFAASGSGENMSVVAGIGGYERMLGASVGEAAPEAMPMLAGAEGNGGWFCEGNAFAARFTGKSDTANYIYLRCCRPLEALEDRLLRILGANAGTALDNILLNREIISTQKELIFTLGDVVESRSHETANHVRRVAEYSRFLALAYGLDEKEAELLRLASPMHDVGKIGIPDAILLKPGRLTTEEFEVMKSHTVLGYQILRSSSRKIIRSAAVVALQHHERWDGKGYPEGLKGEDIHVFGRITAITDVFDALATPRVYKAAWDLERIVELVRHERGGLFEPALADLLLGNLDDILKIRDAYPDEG
ncbi:response regulator RpfG family c-di-GMP phosphodiesterase [Desulfobaculum xiamenense]|uniref:Response regulator RpfG family c-di-GMP phosphodiesterase n=1 Tax=Desulfobaculum xiamenense TaxID=995050 RepID=A0A846QP86_9BACT|nr:HD domain-containing phosphohydrolase [Desulfobaculum xiamenense]NJB66519.1 response regulator RpfG family c-di-GMP phosphodiesterase [Desulfobaculum xiamenense]